MKSSIIIIVCVFSVLSASLYAAFGPAPEPNEPVSTCNFCGLKYYPRLVVHDCQNKVVVSMPKQKNCNCANCNKINANIINYKRQIQSYNNDRTKETVNRMKALGISYTGVRHDMTPKQVKAYADMKQKTSQCTSSGCNHANDKQKQTLNKIFSQTSSYSVKL
jgi:hypothetical protein